MPEQTVIPVKPEIAAHTYCDEALYEALYRRSVEDPEGFWAEQAGRLEWMRFPQTIKSTDFGGDVDIRWFEDGVLNA
ncbi:acetyl-coenzyme A synthetase N-terminal domain-containing protein, partial [Eilatimonas milleporae]